MRWYEKITYFENRNRIKSLIEFRDDIVKYFNNITLDDISGQVIENDIARKLRTEINLNLDKNYLFIISAGVNTSISYLDPIVGIKIENINVILAIFHLPRFRGGPREALDVIERAIGVYEGDKINSLIRTLNPFFWLWRIMSYIASLPFKLIGELGFEPKKVEASLFGRIIKGIVLLIQFVAALLAIKYYLIRK